MLLSGKNKSSRKSFASKGTKKKKKVASILSFFKFIKFIKEKLHYNYNFFFPSLILCHNVCSVLTKKIYQITRVKTSSRCRDARPLIGFSLPAASYLLCTKIIIPPLKYLNAFSSDEIHHQITPLISFSWKCYIRPRWYLIYCNNGAEGKIVFAARLGGAAKTNALITGSPPQDLFSLHCNGFDSIFYTFLLALF